MFVMLTSGYPPDKMTEIFKIFIKARQETSLSAFIKRVGIWGGNTELGTKNYVLYEIEDENLAEGLREINRFQVPLLSVKGYWYKIETLTTVEEALTWLGFDPKEVPA